MLSLFFVWRGRSSTYVRFEPGRLDLNAVYRTEFLRFVVKRVDNKPKAPLLESCKTLELATVPGGHTAWRHRSILVTTPKDALDQLRLLPADLQARRAAEVLERRHR